MPTRITKKPWFGPKRTIGWGWSPTSWEGVVVLVVFLILVIGSVILWHGWGAAVVALLIVLLFVVALLTGDPPGSPRVR